MDKNYKKGMFEEGKNVFFASQIETDTIIALKNNKYFYVYDVVKEFINEETADLYSDDVKENEIKPEHSLISIYDENGNRIFNIPGETPCILFKRIDGNIT